MKDGVANHTVKMPAKISHQHVPTAGAWVAALRPQTLAASLGPVAVGSAIAHADGRFTPAAAVACWLAAVFLQIGCNLYNDYGDFVRGADTDARLGPPRAVQRGWLSGQQVRRGAFFSFGLATLVGAYLVAIAGWPIVAIGTVSVMAAIAYTAGPVPLAYHGLGDLFVLVFFGLVAVGGSYYVHTGTVTDVALLAGMAVGVLATAILVVNNLRDRHTDAEARKRTLVVRFGERFGRGQYVAMLLIAYGAVLAIAALTGTGALLALLTLPLAARRVQAVFRNDGAALNRELARTAQLGLAFSVLLAIGVLL